MKLILYSILSIISVVASIKTQGQEGLGKTEVMVLGTEHLNQVEGFTTDMLQNLVVKLETLGFDAIAVEGMATQLLYDIQSRNDSAFMGVLSSFGGYRLRQAQKAQDNYGISFLEAQTEIDSILQDHPIDPENRMRLLQYFVASGDMASAVLQYSYDQNAIEAQCNTHFDSLLVSILQENSNLSNEIYSLAIPLAKRAGLQRIEYIDNFQDEALLLKHFPKFIPDYLQNKEQFDDIANKPVFQKAAELRQRGVKNEDLLDLFVFLNSEEYQNQDYKAQWEIWLQTNFPSGSDISRFALWEMRNMQIASNIVKTAAFYPRQRMLVIIGASHKSFLEKYLRQVPFIELLKFN